MHESIIQQYVRQDAKCEDWDPRAPEVAARVARLITERLPWAKPEHVGSSAVPDCAGKGIIDLQIPVGRDQLQPMKDTLEDLGFQSQEGTNIWPEERPMRTGAIEHEGRQYRLHVHVIPGDSDEIALMLRFRDALRSDPELREDYVAHKRAVIAGGDAQADRYTVAKSEWIEAFLAGRVQAGATGMEKVRE